MEASKKSKQQSLKQLLRKFSILGVGIIITLGIISVVGFQLLIKNRGESITTIQYQSLAEHSSGGEVEVDMKVSKDGVTWEDQVSINSRESIYIRVNYDSRAHLVSTNSNFKLTLPEFFQYKSASLVNCITPGDIPGFGDVVQCDSGTSKQKDESFQSLTDNGLSPVAGLYDDTEISGEVADFGGSNGIFEIGKKFTDSKQSGNTQISYFVSSPESLRIKSENYSSDGISTGGSGSTIEILGNRYVAQNTTQIEGYSASNKSHGSLFDLLDTTRGAGYLEFQLSVITSESLENVVIPVELSAAEFDTIGDIVTISIN